MYLAKISLPEDNQVIRVYPFQQYKVRPVYNNKKYSNRHIRSSLKKSDCVAAIRQKNAKIDLKSIPTHVDAFPL